VLNLLFVYGTLRSEFDNRYARLLRSHADFVGRATMPGSIYRVRHYPAFRPTPTGKVQGEMYRLNDPEPTLEALDEYEDAEFERVVLNGAWIYLYKLQPADDRRIASGDFCLS
jgi:gamma-glutamylcyclotransferase (GGCT)/AIG2-like uncharacterized protein YtfP